MIQQLNKIVLYPSRSSQTQTQEIVIVGVKYLKIKGLCLIGRTDHPASVQAFYEDHFKKPISMIIVAMAIVTIETDGHVMAKDNIIKDKRQEIEQSAPIMYSGNFTMVAPAIDYAGPWVPPPNPNLAWPEPSRRPIETTDFLSSNNNVQGSMFAFPGMFIFIGPFAQHIRGIRLSADVQYDGTPGSMVNTQPIHGLLFVGYTRREAPHLTDTIAYKLSADFAHNSLVGTIIFPYLVQVMLLQVFWNGYLNSQLNYDIDVKNENWQLSNQLWKLLPGTTN